jgi:hypothetical protein
LTSTSTSTLTSTSTSTSRKGPHRQARGTHRLSAGVGGTT